MWVGISSPINVAYSPTGVVLGIVGSLIPVNGNKAVDTWSFVENSPHVLTQVGEHQSSVLIG